MVGKNKEILQLLLTDTGFAGFSFSTSFSLKFERNKASKFNGHDLPWCVELRLDSAWGFGDPDAWKKKVLKEGSKDSLSPEEPIQAFELARLRWSEGANVRKINCENGRIHSKFLAS